MRRPFRIKKGGINLDHYYSQDPTSKSEERIIDYELDGHKFKFISDNGVFSKNHIDFASEFLIKTIFEEVEGDILDVGCGYGVIGIILSKNKNIKTVTMLDVNHRALELARRNVALNKVEASIVESDGFSNIKNEYDTIITNPPIRAGKAVIYKIYEDANKHLRKGGVLYLVINKKHGAPSTIKELNDIFGNCEIVDKKAGFHVLKCIKEN